MSKVVHIRLSDESIYTAMVVLQKNGINTTNLPLATIMRRYIEGSTTNYQKQTSLSMPADLPNIIANLCDDSPIPIEMPDISIVEDDTKDMDKDKMEHIRRAMEDAIEDGMPEVELREAIEEEMTLPPEPWLASGVLSFEKIKSIAPKDILIEQASDETKVTSHILQKAIQCVYSELSTSEWGTKHTIGLVQKIIPTIERYFKNPE